MTCPDPAPLIDALSDLGPTTRLAFVRASAEARDRRATEGDHRLAAVHAAVANLAAEVHDDENRLLRALEDTGTASLERDDDGPLP